MTTTPAPADGNAGSEHLGPDLLADLAEGLLDAAATDAAEAHLVWCVACSEDFALICGDASADAWDAITPEPIPAEVFAVIEAAIHREPPLRAELPSPRTTIRTPRDRRSHGRIFKFAFGGLASVALVVGGIAFVNSMTVGESTSASGADAKGAIPAAGGPAMVSVDEGNQIQSRVSQLLALQPDSVPHPAAAPSGTVGTGGTAACWENPRPGSTPLASTSLVFRDQPAELLVFPRPDDAAHVDAVIVAADCHEADTRQLSNKPDGLMAEIVVVRP